MHKSPMTIEQAGTGPVLRRAAVDSVAVILAYAPFGLTLGATLAATGVPALVAWSSSPLLFGGAAQLVSVQLLDAGAGAAFVVLAALVVNARLLLYSAAIAPHAAGWPRRWRRLGAYLLVDPVYALAAGRFTGPEAGTARQKLTYYLAVGGMLWVAWMTLTGIGALLAGALPAVLNLELAAPLTFLLLLLPMLTSRPAYFAAAVGGTVSLAAAGLPLGLGLLAGAGAGIAAGAVVGERRA